ncbi:MAG: hypothetical protein ACYSYT_05860, partial [Planctomycetota bacterium]
MAECLTAKKLAITVTVCLAVLAAIIGVCASVGTQQISLAKVLSGPGETPGVNIDYEIFLIRLQRVILAALVG